MSLKVKFGGPLVRFKPENSVGNAANVPTSEGLTLFNLLRNLDIPEDQRLLVILNGAVVAADAYTTTALADNDDLSLMPPIQAG